MNLITQHSQTSEYVRRNNVAMELMINKIIEAKKNEDKAMAERVLSCGNSIDFTVITPELNAKFMHVSGYVPFIGRNKK